MDRIQLHEPLSTRSPTWRATSRAGRALLATATDVAPLSHPLLIRGESGTGKTHLARHVRRASGRTGPLVEVNCGALARGLAASELFGHVRGAFTGADRARAG